MFYSYNTVSFSIFHSFCGRWLTNCIGHVLFEMCSGYELYAPKPTARHLEDLSSYPQVLRLFQRPVLVGPERFPLFLIVKRLSKSWITSSTARATNTLRLPTWPFSSSSATSTCEKWDARRLTSPLLRTWSNPFKLCFSVSNLYLPRKSGKQVLSTTHNHFPKRRRI